MTRLPIKSSSLKATGHGCGCPFSTAHSSHWFCLHTAWRPAIQNRSASVSTKARLRWAAQSWGRTCIKYAALQNVPLKQSWAWEKSISNADTVSKSGSFDIMFHFENIIKVFYLNHPGPLLIQVPGSPYLSPSSVPNTLSCKESTVCSNYVFSTAPSTGI